MWVCPGGRTGTHGGVHGRGGIAGPGTRPFSVEGCRWRHKHGLASRPVPSDLYFGLIVFPSAVVAKINSKHGITEQDVRDAVQWPARPAAYWIGLDDDPRGPRAVAVGRTAFGTMIQVVLYPVGDPADGTWRLGTAVVQT